MSATYNPREFVDGPLTDFLKPTGVGRVDLNIEPVAGTINVGDTVTGITPYDYRSWWQRHAPEFMGGKKMPEASTATVTSMISATSANLSDGSTVTF